MSIGWTARRSAAVVGLPLLASVIISCSSSVGEPPTVSLLSSKPEYVTGDDALVKVSVNSQYVPITVTLNGVDVSDAFKRSVSTPNEFVGLVKGIKHGSNELIAGHASPCKKALACLPSRDSRNS